jgi:hypothetical protein
MTYVPQPGTVPHRAIKFFKTQPPGFEISAPDLAEALGMEPSQIGACLVHPRQKGALKVRSKPGTKALFWSLGDCVPERPPRDVEEFDAEVDGIPPPMSKYRLFNAARWIDGSLILTGIKVTKDGTAILPPEYARVVEQALAA